MKVFVSGSISITFLTNAVQERLENMIRNNLTVIIGDAGGVDSAVQKFLSERHYPNVIVYSVGSHVRANYGQWPIHHVDDCGLQGRAKFTLKDVEMAKDANFGMMVWDGKSKGTLANIQEMQKLGKRFCVAIDGKFVSDIDINAYIKSSNSIVREQQEVLAI